MQAHRVPDPPLTLHGLLNLGTFINLPGPSFLSVKLRSSNWVLARIKQGKMCKLLNKRLAFYKPSIKGSFYWLVCEPQFYFCLAVHQTSVPNPTILFNLSGSVQKHCFATLHKTFPLLPSCLSIDSNFPT